MKELKQLTEKNSLLIFSVVPKHIVGKIKTQKKTTNKQANETISYKGYFFSQGIRDISS